MADIVILAGAAVIALAAAALWFSRHRGSEKEMTRSLKPDGFLMELGRSALMEYTPTNRYENATIATVREFLGSGRKVVLLTQAPRARMYLEGFRSEAAAGHLKVVNITSENPLAKPQMFRISPAEEETAPPSPETDIVSVSVNNLEFVTEITQTMEEGSVLIFEALTGVILALGAKKKEAVYKFFSTIVEEMSTKKRILVAFLNKDAHEKEVVSAYEGLFMRIFRIENGFLHSLKGERIKIELHKT